jgi:hypothetical protein
VQTSLTPRAGGCLLALMGGAGALAVLLAALLTLLSGRSVAHSCGGVGSAVPAAPVVGGAAQTVGASEYGGPGDPSSGTIGSSGADLLRLPDSYAELGGLSFATAANLGRLPYGTPLRITWAGRSAIAYKRDIGLGGGPVAGYRRAIDLWWQFAGRLGIPYEHGEWSGPVRIERPPATGAAPQLTGIPGASPPGAGAPSCAGAAGGAVALAPGSRAVLLPDGRAAAPVDAPPAVKAMIAAGNQIAGRPYLYGGGHGLPLDVLSPVYDCSSSVEHLLYGGGLLAAGDTVSSSVLEGYGLPGPGRWVTLYASAQHVFMYVAGLRWDTWNAAGPQDGGPGIGWHPLVRSAAGFVARHPVGL